MSDTETMTDEQRLASEFQPGLDPNAPEQMAGRIAELEASVETLTEQLATANKRADTAEAATKKAKAKVSAGEVSAKPRKLKADAFDGERDELRDAITAGEKIEIVFSDGKHEVPGVAPLNVEGEAWRDHTRGLMLRDPITVIGPDASSGGGGTSTTIKGYALLIDGKQVAYTERSDPLTIAPGQRVELADDIYF